MIIEVIDHPGQGLVMIALSLSNKAACQGAYNGFLAKHGLRAWGLLARGSFIDDTVYAQSVTPSGNPSDEITLPPGSDVVAGISELLDSHFRHFIATETVSKFD